MVLCRATPLAQHQPNHAGVEMGSTMACQRDMFESTHSTPSRNTPTTSLQIILKVCSLHVASTSSTNAQTQQMPGGGLVCILRVFEAALELNNKSPAPWESVDLDVDQFTALYCCIFFVFVQYHLSFVLHRPFSYHLHQLFILSSHILSYIHNTSRRMTTRPTSMSTSMKARIRATPTAQKRV